MNGYISKFKLHRSPVALMKFADGCVCGENRMRAGERVDEFYSPVASKARCYHATVVKYVGRQQSQPGQRKRVRLAAANPSSRQL
jgi:hypothetical protein